ncbi:MAG: carboxypeptidase-like regulatory domain-containing protein [Acidobacteria bacterium]|nr:carboxypeptidase-like regulatory domain-containing protein [Acidobacteriota bacterium]MCI0718539.1 carboxypeptidase-like regulatory domain-containing protein [Acidobacteriota bacterium]
MPVSDFRQFLACVFAVLLLDLPFALLAQRQQNRAPRPQAANEKSNLQPGSIKGRVVAVENGQGMSKVTLSLIPLERREEGRPLTVRTTPDGQYEFKQVAPGRYRLFALRNGYARQGYGQKPGNENDLASATPLDVRSGETLDNIDLSLVRGGALEGRVLDQDGEPAARVAVNLIRARYVQGRRVLQPSGSDQTDDRGQFRIYDIPPGTYYLMATPRVFGMTDENRSVYPPIYFPGVLDPQEASKVKMVPGGELRGYDLSLFETRGYQISGKVTSADGQPPRRVFVTAHKVPSSGLSQPASAQGTGAQGDFTLRGLIPGSYRLVAQERRADRFSTGSTVVDIGNQDVSGVVLALGNGAELQGRVLLEGKNQAVNLASLRVSAIPLGDGAGSGFRGRGATGSTLKEDGTFLLKDLAEGPARIVLSQPPGSSYVKSIRAQGKDVTDAPLDLHSGDRIQGLEIVVASNGAQLSGSVKEATNGPPVPGASVLIYPADARLIGPNSRYIRAVKSGQQGEFSVQGLVPGEYKICALLDHESGAEYDPEYLQSLHRVSRTVQLNAGQAANETLEAAPSPARD